MNYLRKNYTELGVLSEIAVMQPEAKVKELQVIMHITQQLTSFDQQLLSIKDALKELLADKLFHNAEIIFAQCFLSDSANQQEQVSNLLSEQLNCVICYVKQPPLDGSKMALWLQFQTDVKAENDGLIYYEHNGYRQYFTTSESNPGSNDNSFFQTSVLLENYEEQLKKRGCTIEKECIRTWFFVRDVDLNYQGLVDARKENFIQNGLSNTTHYIASTGIEGSNFNLDVKVLMNTYAIKGLEEGQIKFLYAKDFLSTTYEYGVTFERGVSIDFGDRRKVYISGTASIDHKGNITHPGDVVKQVKRIWENVEALLIEADCALDDIMQILIYLRDIADYKSVRRLYEAKFPNVPKLIVLAPICRPGWLVEMECIASKTVHNLKYRDL